MKALIKWDNSRAGFVDALRPMVTEAGIGLKTYYEPFITDGALFFSIVPQSYVIGSSMKLIQALYNRMSDSGLQVWHEFDEMQREYLFADDPKLVYYSIRDAFNDRRIYSMDDSLVTAQFLFLMKACYNNTYHVNTDNQFDAPCGMAKTRMLIKRSDFFAASTHLATSAQYNRGQVRGSDFKTTCSSAAIGDFVFLDPPYAQLNVKQQISLYEMIDELGERGVYCLWILPQDFSDRQKRGAGVATDTLEYKHVITRTNEVRVDRITVARNFGKVDAVVSKMNEERAKLILAKQRILRDFGLQPMSYEMCHRMSDVRVMTDFEIDAYVRRLIDGSMR